MKRAIGILAGLALAAAALAQAPFTIVRPADGARVREKVRVQIPKDSVPNGGYIGIFVGGKFVEALIPDARGKFYEYVLDTKGRSIPDGNLKIEAVLYMDSETAAPKILDRSSVNVRVQNSASIKVPSGGLALRYAFAPGNEYVYKQISRTSTAVLSDTDIKMGGARAAELPGDYEVIRLLYSFDQKFGNGDGLVRIQPITPKGSDHLYYNAVLEDQGTESRLYMEEDLGSFFMRLSPTGKQVYSSFPTYYPIDGGPPANNDGDLYVPRPFPVLPSKRVKPGDSWPGWFQFPNLPANKLEGSSAVVPIPARGEFVGVEWEMGRPCAKIRNVIRTNNRTFAGTRFGSSAKDADEKITFEETAWYALDKKVPVKWVINLTVDRKVPQQQNQGGGGGGPAGGPGMIEGGGGPRGRPAGAGGPGGMSGGSGNDNLLAQKGGLEGGARGGRGNLGGAPAQGGQGRGGAGLGGGQGRGQGAGANQWLRIRAQVILVLEK